MYSWDACLYGMVVCVCAVFHLPTFPPLSRQVQVVTLEAEMGMDFLSHPRYAEWVRGFCSNSVSTSIWSVMPHVFWGCLLLFDGYHNTSPSHAMP